MRGMAAASKQTTSSAPRGFKNWRFAALANGLKDATAYRWEFLTEILGSAFVPAAVQWVLWYAMFKLGGATEVGGMNYTQMVQYTMVSILFTQVRGGNLDFELQEMIRSGNLSNYLLRPVSVIELVYLRGLAPKLLVAALCLGVGLVFSIVAPEWTGLSPFRLMGAMFLAMLGNVLHYQFSSALAAAAFYWEEAYSILMVKNLLISFLSGELIPLNMFPDNMAWIWKSLPFYFFVYGPTQFSLGHWSTEQFFVECLRAGVWIMAFGAMVHFTWRVGMKRYLSLGG